MNNNFYNNNFYNNKLLTNKSNNLINKIKSNERLFPKSTSYRIEDDNVVLQFNDINYDFYTNQNKSFINLYARRYEDLYSCCFNKSTIDLIDVNNKSINKKIDIKVDCTDITDESCLFFQRFYCRALKDILGSDLPGACSCYEFLPEDRVLIKLGVPNSCLNNKCSSFTSSVKNNVFDDAVMTNDCKLDVCTNLIKLNNLNVEGDIKISSDTLNLVCNK